MSKHRYAVAVLTAALIMAGAGQAFAMWTAKGSGTGAAKAQSLGTPTASAAATTGSATSITVSITAAPAAPSATPSGYRVDRVTPAGTVCRITGTTGSCNDTGRTAGGTTYNYKIYSLLGSNLTSPVWTSSGFATASAATSNPMLHISALSGSAARNGNSGSYHTTVNVTVKDDSGNLVDGVVVTGTWSPASSGAASGCTTATPGSAGQCSFTTANTQFTNTTNETWTVAGLSKSGYSYDSTSNIDSDLVFNCQSSTCTTT